MDLHLRVFVLIITVSVPGLFPTKLWRQHILTQDGAQILLGHQEDRHGIL